MVEEEHYYCKISYSNYMESLIKKGITPLSYEQWLNIQIRIQENEHSSIMMVRIMRKP